MNCASRSSRPCPPPPRRPLPRPRRRRQPRPGARRPVAVTPPPAVVEDKPESGVMTLVDPLVELRRRIFIGVLALVIGSVIGFVISDRVLEILRAPIGDQKLIYLELGGAVAIPPQLGGPR